jgi:hypothetical protein
VFAPWFPVPGQERPANALCRYAPASAGTSRPLPALLYEKADLPEAIAIARLGGFRYLELCGETGVLEPITPRETALHYRGDVFGAVLIDRGNGPAHRLGVEPAKGLPPTNVDDKLHMRRSGRHDDDGEGSRIKNRRDLQGFCR